MEKWLPETQPWPLHVLSFLTCSMLSGEKEISFSKKVTKIISNFFFSSRSQEKLIWEIGFFSNRVFCVAVALSIIGQLAVIYFPPLQYIFQTEALAMQDLLLLACLSSSVFVICEAKKWLQRHYFQNGEWMMPSSSSTSATKSNGVFRTKKLSGHIV